MAHTKARSAKQHNPALEKRSATVRGSIPPADRESADESPQHSYVTEITRPPPAPPRSSKRLRKKRKVKSDTETTQLQAHRVPLLVQSYDEKIKRPTLDVCIQRYPEVGQDLESVRAAAASYHSARTRTFATAVCAGVMDFLDDHSRRHMRFSVNALSLLVDPQIDELEKRMSRGVVEPPRLKKLTRYGSESWKASTADGRILVALGLAWQLRVNTPEQRVAARKEQLERARAAFDKLADMVETQQIPAQLQGLVREWKLPAGSREELISRIMRAE